jgi:hypothetical protein
MGKSLRSKVKRRFRSLKREVLNRGVLREQLNDISAKLKMTAEGKNYREPEVKNAFLYPNDPQAKFPQYQKQPLVDFRSSHIEFAGHEFIGALRKKAKSIAASKSADDGIEIELEQIAEQDGEESQPEVDDDLMADFDKLKLEGKKRRGKKNRMETEDDKILQKGSKKIHKKKDDVKKSKKYMRF